MEATAIKVNTVTSGREPMLSQSLRCFCLRAWVGGDDLRGLRLLASDVCLTLICKRTAQKRPVVLKMTLLIDKITTRCCMFRQKVRLKMLEPTLSRVPPQCPICH